jgi:membrane protein
MADSTIARLRDLQARARDFLDEKDLGLQDEAQLTRTQKLAHFVLIVVKRFIRNRCPVRAGALSYTTLLALIPLLAVGISVASSLLKQKDDAASAQFYSQLIDKFVGVAAPHLGMVPKEPGEPGEQDDARREVVQGINQFVKNIQSGAIGVVGMIALVMVAISLLATIEATFNDMWGITRGRSWFARVIQYWAGITLGPLLIIIAFTLTTGPHLKGTKVLVEQMPYLGTLLFAFMPLVVVTGAFTLFYFLLPNTKVQWKAALVGGIVGGCLWHLNNVAAVLFVSRVITYKKIYQSFYIVPVFMFGLYVSWLIVLFGAQVAYVYQNLRTYLQERQAEGVNQRGREFVALRLMTFIGQRFVRGEKAAAISEMAEALTVPSRLVSQILSLLAETKILLEVKSVDHAYTPARPLETITVQDVFQALRTGEGREVATKDEPVRDLVRGEFEKIEHAESEAAGAVTLRALVNEAEAARA